MSTWAILEQVAYMVILLEIVLWVFAFLKMIQGDKSLYEKLMKGHIKLYKKFVGGKKNKKGYRSRSGSYKGRSTSIEEKKTFRHKFSQERIDEINEVMAQVREGILTFKGAKKELEIGSFQLWYLLASDVDDHSGVNSELYSLNQKEINEIERTLKSVEDGELTYEGALSELDIEIQQLMIFVGMFSEDARHSSAEQSSSKKNSKEKKTTTKKKNNKPSGKDKNVAEGDLNEY